MSRLNELLHCSAENAATVLENSVDVQSHELQAAITNALMKIDCLQRKVESLEKLIDQNDNDDR